MKSKDPLDIILFHVGGVGGYGPVREVIDRFPERTIIVCFEANPSPKDLLIQKKYAARGVRTVFVPKCVGIRSGKQALYVNKHPESSSIFPAAQEMRHWHVPYQDIRTWGENCEVERVAEVDMVTLDDLVRNGTLPTPDILSMDVQGSEMPIMRGGHRAVQDALCVVSEVDFVQLYEGQELFEDQQKFLSERGYRLADIMNTQEWHPGPAAGRGFLVMGEALYLRDPRALRAHMQGRGSDGLFHRLVKLATIAYAFRRLSFSSEIVKSLLDEYGERARSLLVSEPNLKRIYETQQYMESHHADYVKDGRFFYRNAWVENARERRRALRERLARWKGKALQAVRRPFGALRRP